MILRSWTQLEIDALMAKVTLTNSFKEVCSSFKDFESIDILLEFRELVGLENESVLYPTDIYDNAINPITKILGTSWNKGYSFVLAGLICSTCKLETIAKILGHTESEILDRLKEMCESNFDGIDWYEKFYSDFKEKMRLNEKYKNGGNSKL